MSTEIKTERIEYRNAADRQNKKQKKLYVWLNAKA